ncbi:hypothetical protein Trydic_g13886 [Trypoxylus dichotomus]
MILYIVFMFFIEKISEIFRKGKIICQYSSILLHSESSINTLKWTINSIQNSEKIPIKVYNSILSKVIDMLIGFIALYIFFEYENIILKFLNDIAENIIYGLKNLLIFLMGSPIGLKLNYAFNTTLGTFFFYHIFLWKTFMQFIRPYLYSVFYILLIPASFGLSFQAAILDDLIKICTIHVYCIYIYAARLYGLQINGLISLWRLFIGRKYNPLRNRIDSHQYSHNQLFIGTLGFTIFLFLLPTTLLYYVVFTVFRLFLKVLNLSLIYLRVLFQHLPIYSVVLWLIDSPLIAATIVISVKSEVEDDIPVVLHATLKSLPLMHCIKSTTPTSNFDIPKIAWQKNVFRRSLQSNDRKERKNAFQEFAKFVSSKNEEWTLTKYHSLFNESHIYVFTGLRDKSEPVREEAIKFIKTFLIDILPTNDYYLSYIFPMLVERLGSCEIIEESEEIRLQLVQLLENILDKYKDNDLMKPFLDDSIVVLKETVKDKFPAIKEKSCQCIVKLAHILPRDFHMRAENLVKPVLSNFSHQRYKIRCEAISCIGEIILNSTYKALDEVVGPLAERLFDQIPAVRRTVAQVAARWLLEYRDRYSFFHKLLPLILTGLNDEVLETRQEAHRLWNIIGQQYQTENENDLKDQLDYLTEIPKHYPKHLTRPNLGCRVLVQRNVSKLAKAISKELLSWQSDIRVRCSQLLCSIVLHAEADITQNLQDLLPAMYTAARDEDRRVADNIVIASEMLGLFVIPKTWTKIILPAIEDGPHYGHLSVLAALIRGCPQEIIQHHLEEIANLLADNSICQSRKKKYQAELLNCADSLVAKYQVDTSDFGKHLFTILVTLISLKDVENEFIDISHLEKLSEALHLDNKYELWGKYCEYLLKSIGKDPKSWTVVSAERCIFETILFQSEEAFGENLPLLGEILVNALDIEVDAESRLKTFIALTTVMDNKQIIFKNARGDLPQFLETLVTDIFVPALVWHAGRTAEAMRTMAASCLFSALNPNDGAELFISSDNLKPLIEKLVPLLLSLTEDAAYMSRQLAIQDLVLLKEMMERRKIWDLESLLKIYPEIVKRLDDPTEKVRICAIKSLTAILTDVPSEFLKDTFNSHHEYLIDTLLIHFDDDHVVLQDLIMDTLKTLAKVCKDFLLQKITRQQSLFRNQKGCNDVIAYLKKIDNIA